MYSTCTSGCLKSNMISWNSFKHGGSGVQFKVSFEHSVSKGRKDLVVSPSDNIETIQTECQNVTTVTQMLANRLQGSFIPQIKRIPPSKDISFNLLWIKCQCCYAMILFFETSAVVFPEQNGRNPAIVLRIDFVICLCWRWYIKIVILSDSSQTYSKLL